MKSEFASFSPTLYIWIRALRVYQWCKNFLIFVPLVLAGPLTLSQKILPCFLGFLCICFLSSGTYLINDLIDLEADQQHHRKKFRPLASGELSLLNAYLSLPIIFGIVISLATFLPFKFGIVCLGYLIITLSYSFALKKKPIMDLIILACLFSLRLLAGMVLLETQLSPWLLAFSMFFFFSLASIKRYSECTNTVHSKILPGRGYERKDSTLLMIMGIASSFCSSIVFFIYLMDPTSSILQTYDYPKFLWAICIILGYWLGRAWYMTSHNQMHDDPILFAFKDKPSLIMGLIVILLVTLAHGTFL